MEHNFDASGVCQTCFMRRHWDGAAGSCTGRALLRPDKARESSQRVKKNLVLRRRAMGPTVIEALIVLLEREIGLEPGTGTLPYEHALQALDWARGERERMAASRRKRRQPAV